MLRMAWNSQWEMKTPQWQHKGIFYYLRYPLQRIKQQHHTPRQPWNECFLGLLCLCNCPLWYNHKGRIAFPPKHRAYTNGFQIFTAWAHDVQRPVKLQLIIQGSLIREKPTNLELVCGSAEGSLRQWLFSSIDKFRKVSWISGRAEWQYLDALVSDELSLCSASEA